LKQQFALGAALLLLALGTGQAGAQAIYVGPPVGALPVPTDEAAPADAPVPAYEVVTIVRSTGLTPLGAPVRRGATYVLLAANRRHEVVRVTVNAWSGDIIRIAAAGYDARPSAAAGPVRPGLPPMARARDLNGRLPPVPPRNVPNVRSASAPVASLEPAGPPLPRPRPSIASNEGGQAEGPSAVPAPLTTGSIEAPVQIAPVPAAAAPQPSKPDLHLAPVVPLD
jgi:hypothetical protein